jgi:hypothetical protein
MSRTDLIQKNKLVLVKPPCRQAELTAKIAKAELKREEVEQEKRERVIERVQKWKEIKDARLQEWRECQGQPWRKQIAH